MTNERKKPSTPEEAIFYALEFTTAKLTREQTEERIKSLSSLLQYSNSDENFQSISQDIENLKTWLDSDALKSGNYPQAIDTLIIELIEWRAMFYAFQETDLNHSAFSNSIFFQQWKVGGVYAMYSHLGKLVSSDLRDHSLRRLWLDIEKFISPHVETSEMEHISSCFMKKAKRFEREQSNSMLFRHTVIAHNERSAGANLKDLDNDIKLLIRAWSVVSIWVDHPMLFPWRDSKQALGILENFYNPKEISLLRDKRQEYIDKTTEWCVTNLVTKDKTSKSPFGRMSVSIDVS